MSRLNTYTDPLSVPLSSSLTAPITIVSPSFDTLPANWSPATPSFAVSLATCVQPDAGSPAVSRVKTYADPLMDPSSSSRYAPITIVSPSFDTLRANWSSAAPSPAVSLATCVQLDARSPAVSRVKTYADPLSSPLSSSPFAPITTVSPSIDAVLPK